MIITTAWRDGIRLGSELRFMKGKASSGMEEGAFLLQFSLLFDKLTVSNYVIYYSKGGGVFGNSVAKGTAEGIG